MLQFFHSQNTLEELGRPAKGYASTVSVASICQDPLCFLLLPEKRSSTGNAQAAPVPLTPVTSPPLSCTGEVFHIEGCVSILQFPTPRISMYILLHRVATSCRTVLPLSGLNSFKSVYKMSGDHCTTRRVNQMFYFLISKAGPSKVLLLNK